MDIKSNKELSVNGAKVECNMAEYCKFYGCLHFHSHQEQEWDSTKKSCCRPHGCAFSPIRPMCIEITNANTR